MLVLILAVLVIYLLVKLASHKPSDKDLEGFPDVLQEVLKRTDSKSDNRHHIQFTITIHREDDEDIKKK